MKLTREEEAMASGSYGPGIEKCMNLLIKIGDACGAKQMVRISSAHTMPKEPPELLDEMTKDVARTGTFTTLHSLMSAFDPSSWQKMGIPDTFAKQELADHHRRTDVYRRVGFYQTFTCLPMLVGNLPRQGDYISWIGSGAQLLANSLIGARTNRDGTVANLAAAITGRAPYTGLFLDENRYAEVLVVLEGLEPNQLTYTDFGAIGYYVGDKAQNRNIVIDGLPKGLDINQLKYLIAPLATSGAVSICHIARLTPEAPDTQQALGKRRPSEVLKVGREEIKQTKSLYAEADSDKIDMVIFGCPHCTITEIKSIASLLDGKRIGGSQRLWIGMPYQLYHLAQTMGYTSVIENAGGVMASACMAMIPDAPVPGGVRVVATNSFKAAHYISRLTKGEVRVLIGDMEECIDAVTGGDWRGGSL